MNINIYFLSKKISFSEVLQYSENQEVINFDKTDGMSIQQQFENFIHDSTKPALNYETLSLTTALEQFSKLFKYIFAAGGLIENENRFLFIYRLKKWDLPKGKIDPGESPEQAAIRECEEECGITELSIVKELSPSYHIYEHKGKYILKKTFWYKMSTKHQAHLTPQIEENIEKVEWFDREAINNNVLGNTYPAIIDIIREVI